MCDYPSIKVCISTDSSWSRTRHAPIVVRNVLTFADTGAQANAWSLRNFLATGFDRSKLILATGLVAANHSGIKIEGAFFRRYKGVRR